MNAVNSAMLHHIRFKKVLDNVPLIFRNFPPEDFRDFLLLGNYEEYHAGNIIVSEDNSDLNCGWLVLDGTISVFLRDVFITKIKAGEFLGETFLFKNKPDFGTLTAARPAAVLRFEREKVISYFESRSDRLFKIFLVNLVELQNRKLIYAGKKILHLNNKLINNSSQHF
ncbi:MAG: cyclic nucleotide-binding domain-containing protein [Balneolaceae bacterium]|jgi:CRP-like cAMP-binding protein|nr:MAG: cyclic nucleotide-binding domain-containing protein [Balneolaceae bacterium]